MSRVCDPLGVVVVVAMVATTRGRWELVLDGHRTIGQLGGRGYKCVVSWGGGSRAIAGECGEGVCFLRDNGGDPGMGQAIGFAG